MKRFEYRTEIVLHRDGTHHHNLPVNHEELDELLNRLGAEGWEVWALDGSFVRLKREIEVEAAPAGAVAWMVDPLSGVLRPL